jgi:hypothetical protein
VWLIHITGVSCLWLNAIHTEDLHFTSHIARSS